MPHTMSPSCCSNLYPEHRPKIRSAVPTQLRLSSVQAAAMFALAMHTQTCHNAALCHVDSHGFKVYFIGTGNAVSEVSHCIISLTLRQLLYKQTCSRQYALPLAAVTAVYTVPGAAQQPIQVNGDIGGNACSNKSCTATNANHQRL